MGLPLSLRFALGVTAAFPRALAHLVERAHLRQGGTPERMAERLGQASVPRPRGRLIWLHAASVGELTSAASLLRLLAVQEGIGLLLTTATVTGADAAKRLFPDLPHQFLPIDTPQAVSAFLDHWRPDLAIFIEGDLWPRLMGSLHQRKIPVALINARPSKSRKRAVKAYGAMLRDVALVTVQSPDLVDEFKHLGIAEARIHCLGNLKADIAPLAVNAEYERIWRAARINGMIWAAVSTHQGEDEIVLDAQAQLEAGKARGEAPLLILAPRHPQRGEALALALHQRGLHFSRHSLGEQPDRHTQVHLLDTLGELGTAYAVADLALIGGSLKPGIGGHTPFEPAMLGCAMLVGPHVRNFQSAYDALEVAGAVRVVEDAPELAAALTVLLRDPSALEFMRLAARREQARHQGAAQRSVDYLLPLLEPSGAVVA